MAQAARLSLRMQKELKILLTDPPHGSTLPHLSPDSEPSSSSSSSISTIHAQIQGPEGTVYEKGVFEIKIQIPERYPFQPPGVTFVTPIYHPNIDNGGRICLDILNLPPKGAWQPSLNIWTVITSIRLLLSEPNPDDGLMCEASKEYKYNRQAFDQKAISMTEKFAKAGAGGSCLSIDPNPSQSMMEVKMAAESKPCSIDEHIVDQKKFSGNRRKLSLESSVSSQKRSNELNVNSRNPMEDEGIVQGSKGTGISLDYSSSHDNPNGTRRRLSLESFSQQKIDCIKPDKAVQNHCLLQATSCHDEKRLDQDGESVRGEKSTSSEQLCRVTQKQLSGSTEASRVSNLEQSKGPLSVPQAVDDPHTGFIDRMENVSTNINCKKPCLAGKKLSLRTKGSSKKTTKEDKENMVPARKLPLFSIQSPSSKPINHKLSADNLIYEKLQSNQGDDGNIKKQVTEESALSEAVIVLDSEDSEEETNTPPLRTKLPLARRLGRWRAKA